MQKWGERLEAEQSTNRTGKDQKDNQCQNGATSYQLAQKFGDRVGTSPRTVHRYIRLRGVQMRDSLGR